MSALALFGGTPVAPKGIDENWPEVTETDIAAVTDTLRSGRLSWMNDDQVRELEREWAGYTGTAHCLAVNSGTAALHAAVAAAGIGPGDEVIVPALSFLASATCVLHHQGIPVFADVDPVTFTLDPSDVEHRISRRTKAIIAVHLHGLPADMAAVSEIARRHGLVVIEDAAQAHGATVDGVRAGALGDLGAFSIMAGKNLATAGEGGLLTTNDTGLRNRADAVKMFGETIDPDGHRDYHAHTLGWNYRFSSILAAFTRSQLARLDTYIDETRAGANRLTGTLSELPGVLPPVVPDGRTHVYHHFRVRFDPAQAGLDVAPGPFRRVVGEALTAEGIPVIGYQNRPLPGQRLFAERVGYGRGCPWTCGHTARTVEYRPEEYTSTLAVISGSLLVGSRLCPASFRDPAAISAYEDAFVKVFGRLGELAAYARTIDYAEPWEDGDRLW
ncbi:DegT/DnrJ/EryC1/StrS family aminotransferase [Amycolatopsis acidicola]|uniref:DegT/DnrJ/EryC1/StrS family aminotransferase n=1 Tax=Amycolatopsis acidicola TaxID=2596893 RepID=UPI0014091FAE|nr:DegT/DnrJ/EryC1/StrS family aminotransferase [Amycolatopsis acidicola]